MKVEFHAMGLFSWGAAKRFSFWRCGEGSENGHAGLQHCWLLWAEFTVWLREEYTWSFLYLWKTACDVLNKWRPWTRYTWQLLLLPGGAGGKVQKPSWAWNPTTLPLGPFPSAQGDTLAWTSSLLFAGSFFRRIKFLHPTVRSREVVEICLATKICRLSSLWILLRRISRWFPDVTPAH